MNAVAPVIGNWLEAGLAFLYPPVCQGCGGQRAPPEEGLVCSRCRSQVRFIRPPFCQRCGLPFAGDLTTPFACANCRGTELHFTAARSAVVAHGIVLEAIHRYKYRHALWFEPFLADLLVRAAGCELRAAKWDWLVPVPLHPTRKREREFNQAEGLARRLGAATGIPVHTRCLRRVRPTSTQTRLTREQRAANMRNAFAVPSRARLSDRRIVLIDDVFTTGATTSACARVLRAAGASEVCVWTVARGL